MDQWTDAVVSPARLGDSTFVVHTTQTPVYHHIDTNPMRKSHHHAGRLMYDDGTVEADYGRRNSTSTASGCTV